MDFQSVALLTELLTLPSVIITGGDGVLQNSNLVIVAGQKYYVKKT